MSTNEACPNCYRDKCTGNHEYSMYTVAGEEACAKLVEQIRQEVEVGLGRKALCSRFTRGITIIAKTHAEVWDTEPRNRLLDKFDEICENEGWAKYGYFKDDGL